jgi:hypothetical protein
VTFGGTIKSPSSACGTFSRKREKEQRAPSDSPFPIPTTDSIKRMFDTGHNVDYVPCVP